MKDEPSFLYSVAVAATGFLFSLALAVGVFFLQRWYSGRDRAAADLEEQRARLRDELAATVRSFNKVHPSILLSVVWFTYMDWRVVRFKYELARRIQRTDDDELKSFCANYIQALSQVRKRRKGIPFVQSYHRTMATFRLAVLAEVSLTAYLRGGDSVTLAPFDAAHDGRGGRALNALDFDWADGLRWVNEKSPDPPRR